MARPLLDRDRMGSPFRACAGGLIALVICPFTAPFSTADLPSLFGDVSKAAPSSIDRLPACSSATNSTSVALVPHARSRGAAGLRLVFLPVAAARDRLASDFRTTVNARAQDRWADPPTTVPDVLRV